MNFKSIQGKTSVKDLESLGSYEIYKFKDAPKDYFDDCGKTIEYSKYGKSYEPWFLLFRDLVENGEIV